MLWPGAERHALRSGGVRFAEPDPVAKRVRELDLSAPRQFFDGGSGVLIVFRREVTLQRMNVLDRHKNSGGGSSSVMPTGSNYLICATTTSIAPHTCGLLLDELTGMK